MSFMTCANCSDCEPYICGNVGSGTVQEMQQWVEYMTFDGDSPDGRLARAKTAARSLGSSSTSAWATRTGAAAATCARNITPMNTAAIRPMSATSATTSIYKIACGPNARRLPLDRGADARSRHGTMDGLSLHYYTVPGAWKRKGSATEFDEDEWFTTLKKAFVMEELITQAFRDHGSLRSREAGRA